MEERKDGVGINKGSCTIFLEYARYTFSPPNVYFEDFPSLERKGEREVGTHIY